MSAPGLSRPSVRAPRAMVATADQLATQAGMSIAALGGNAVDIALAASAAIAVCGPHLNGLGGDLFALVHDGSEVHALNASGRAGSGADPTALRADGHTTMPLRNDIRTVTVPGFVDGWLALHERFADLEPAVLLGPAIALAEGGFPASPLLIGSLAMLDDAGRSQLGELARQALGTGDRVRRPGVARTLRSIGAAGRDAFYDGEFGHGLIEVGAGWFDETDLATSSAEWVVALSTTAWGVDLWTCPPNSQGYLALAGAALADGLDLPDDPDDPQWAHLLIEAATAVGYDRPAVLHDGADGARLLRDRAARGHMVDPRRASRRPLAGRNGDTTYLCATADQMGVSIIQSNASGFGSWLVEPNTAINLHNRGLGFSLEAGHPAELAPGRRPPHTLLPALATRDGRLEAVFGTMGGDAQPQVVLQLAARLFRNGQSPQAAVDAARWALRGPATGFDTWTAADGPVVNVEGHAPSAWSEGLSERGHRVALLGSYDSGFGHAHAIRRDARGWWSGAADPRTVVGSVAGT